MFRHHEMVRMIIEIEKPIGFDYLARQEELEEMATEELVQILRKYEAEGKVHGGNDE